MDYEIGKRNDLIGIIKLYSENKFNFEYSDEYAMRLQNIWDDIEKNNIKYFIAKDNKKIIGSCFICIIPNLTHNGEYIGFIENVIVDENYRKKGIGKKLIEMAIEYAKESNCYKVTLQSGITRKNAHKFYEKIGFNGEGKKAYELRFPKKIEPILD